MRGHLPRLVANCQGCRHGSSHRAARRRPRSGHRGVLGSALGGRVRGRRAAGAEPLRPAGPGGRQRRRSCRPASPAGSSGAPASGSAGTSYTWHWAPDGGACFADGDGWIYVSNSRDPVRSAAPSAVRFGADGRDRSTPTGSSSGTNVNCAGGATPVGHVAVLRGGRRSAGSSRPTRAAAGRPSRAPAMGRFKHEAAACDPDRRVVYLTEDETDGCFYRFRPDTWGDLTTGRLEVLCAPGRPDLRPGDLAADPGPRRLPDGDPPPGRRGEALQRRRGLLRTPTASATSPPRATTGCGRYDAAASTPRLAYDDRGRAGARAADRRRQHHRHRRRRPLRRRGRRQHGDQRHHRRRAWSRRSCGSRGQAAVRDHRPGLLPRRHPALLLLPARHVRRRPAAAASPTR